MSRSFPWRSSCPSAVVDLLGQLPSCELLLVRRIGPTCFLLSKRDGIGKYRTSVGDPHSCSCSANDLCIHVIFVLCKVFFLPKENPLIWQRSLVAAEVEEILRSENQLKSTWRNAEDTPQDIVVPKPIEEGDVCPICFDELIGNAQLDYCQGGCGKYIHTRCFRHYMRHNSAGPLRCPYCRVLWTHNAKPHSKSCKACKKCICGPSYRCLFCPEYFLCTTCFHRGDAHSGHPFSLLGGREIAERTRTEATSLPTVDSQQPARVPDNLRPLMYREIEPDDYEALLQLDDQNNKRKLSIEEFATLHRENWSAGLLTDECNICLDSFDVTSSCVWLTCGHYFHVSCAQKWLTEHTAECPIDHVPVIVTRSSPLSETNSPFIAFNEVNVNRARRFNHRLLQRRRINLPNTSVDPRNVARASRRTVGSVNDNNVSVSALELHAVPLGIGPRRLRNNDQFFYGTL
uniref:RING-type domain-containing protein n=1 Tax=Trypanosoma congolense (strain IL3000) TaxID=1068625 RepID=G0UN11_TRYCI|nr:conserved hypothetical protein [Trypanosoma congolense IL3000]